MSPEDVKVASESRLVALNVALDDSLPTIEHPSELAPRSAMEVSTRACVLSHLIGIAYGRSGAEMLEWLTEAKLVSTPIEN